MRYGTTPRRQVRLVARRDIEARTGHAVVSGENYKTLRQSRVAARQLPLPDASADEPDE